VWRPCARQGPTSQPTAGRPPRHVQNWTSRWTSLTPRVGADSAAAGSASSAYPQSMSRSGTPIVARAVPCTGRVIPIKSRQVGGALPPCRGMTPALRPGGQSETSRSCDSTAWRPRDLHGPVGLVVGACGKPLALLSADNGSCPPLHTRLRNAPIISRSGAFLRPWPASGPDFYWRDEHWPINRNS